MTIRDEELVSRCRSGDTRAFAELVQRHETSIRAILRAQVRDRTAVDDLFQQAMIDAWKGMGGLDDMARFGSWVRQIARNRSRDYYREGARRIQPVADEVLHRHLDRLGTRPEAAASETVSDLLEHMPPLQRQSLRMHYLDEMDIRDIAGRCGVPEGTIKRRLWEGRQFLRNRLGLPRVAQQKRINMTATSQRRHLFPISLPPVSIEPMRAGPSHVQVEELLWFCIVPRPGQAGAWAVYGTDGKLREANLLNVTGPATVHGQHCVEIAMRRWTAASGWRAETDLLYGRLTEQSSQWLAVVDHDPKHGAEVYTFRDTNFAIDFGDMPRHYTDHGRVTVGDDGQVRCRSLAAKSGALGWGAFEVRIGRRRHRCLRILDVGDAVNCPAYSMSEAFVDRSGRVVFCRSYSQSKRAADSAAKSLTVNGVVYHHVHDLVSGLALSQEGHVKIGT